MEFATPAPSLLCSYGKNVFPEPPFTGFWALFFDSFKDIILMILVAAAIVSFAMGMYESPRYGGVARCVQLGPRERGCSAVGRLRTRRGACWPHAGAL